MMTTLQFEICPRPRLEACAAHHGSLGVGWLPMLALIWRKGADSTWAQAFIGHRIVGHPMADTVDSSGGAQRGVVTAIVSGMIM
jgi:hypothetical protein